MPFTIKLRKILLSKWLYISIFALCLCITLVRCQTASSKVPTIKDVSSSFYITEKKEYDDFVILELKGKIGLQVSCSMKTKQEKDFFSSLVVGSHIFLEGKLEEIEDSYHNFNSFSKKKQQKRKHIFYQVTPESIRLLNQDSLYFGIKEKLYTLIERFEKTSPYLKTFLLGDATFISSDVKKAYQTIGVSHLFALSGMHISFLMGGFYHLLRKGKRSEKACFYITLILLVIYLLLVRISPSILRASLFFLLFGINKHHDLHIAPFHILLLILSIHFLLNPFVYEEIGFLYSFSISASLVLFRKKLEKGNFFFKLLKTSSFSFFVSLPITLFYQYQVNFLTVFFNIVLVPFVSMLLFPLSFLVVLFPPLETIYQFFLFLLEQSAIFFSHLSFFTFPCLKMPCFLYLFYFCFFYLCLFKRTFFCLYFLVLFSHLFLFPYLKPDTLTMIDVGQGDCFLFESKGKALLLDTGGKEEVGQNRKQNASDLLQNLKARGIRRISIVLSHGDLDHAGNALVLVKEMQVDRITTNLGKMNTTEKQLYKESVRRKIPFQKVNKEASFSLGNFTFLQLNKAFQEENDSSAVYFIMHEDKKMLFMGDASKKTEEFLLNEYDLPNLSLLKIGHHGSKTSTTNQFLESFSCDFALISSGRDNKFHHPSPVVIERLHKKNIQIFNTQETGSVRITFPSFKIETAR